METAGIELKCLEPIEYDALVKLWNSCGLPYKPEGRDSRESIEKEMKIGTGFFLIAVLDGNLIGSVLATHDSRKGWINRLAVLPDHRKKGVARLLLREAEKWLGEQGIGIFACLIEGYNSISVEVFERMGYKEFKGVKYFTKRTHLDI